MTEQVTRLLCLPLALGAFLYAAQISGGFVERDMSKLQKIHAALK